MTAKLGERYQDRYEVLEKIGEGTFADVFRAREVPSGQVVALKVLKDTYLSVKEVVERFQREVFAVASISSPHVVALLDFGISDDNFYIVMEFVQGKTLREVMRPGPWSAEGIITVIEQIGHALGAAHTQGILHRDLKPENVILVEREQSWRAKVLDFGLAKLPELERKLGLEPLTRKGYCFGTPQYMSPEQIVGKPLDPSSDLYALGVIAYEMVASTRPWDGKDPREIMMAVLKQPPPMVTTLPPALAPRIGEINLFFERALAKDHDHRPQDTATFLREFSTALFGDRPPERKFFLVTTEISPQSGNGSGGVTIVNPKQRSDQTIQMDTVGRDTESVPALNDSGSLPIDQGSSIPIYVTPKTQPERLRSDFLPTPGPDDTVLSIKASEKTTVPFGTEALTEKRSNDGPSDREQRSLRRIAIFFCIGLVIAVTAIVSYQLGRMAH